MAENIVTPGEKAEERWNFLDRGEEPEEIEDRVYMEEIKLELERATGMEAPEVRFMEYSDSDQLLYDSMVNTLKMMGIDDKETGSWSPPLGKIWGKARNLKMRFMSDRTLGLAKIDERHIDEIVSEGEIKVGIAADNIEKYCEDPKMGKRYTMTHEAAHGLQFYNFPGIIRERVLMKNYPFNRDLRRRAEATSYITEGHAKFFTDRIFEEKFGGRPERKKGKIRKAVHSAGKKVFDVTDEEYEVGNRFIDEIHSRGGLELVMRAWEKRPDTVREVREPERWISRVRSDG